MSYLISILFHFLLFSVNAQAGNSSAQIKDDFTKKLLEISHINKTITSQFELIREIKQLDKPVKSVGSFYYDSNGYMALIYSVPAGDKIILKDDIFHIITAGKLNSSKGKSNPMLEQISQMMNACMKGDITQLGKGWLSEYSIVDGNYVINLIPQDKRTQKYLTSIVLVFDPSNLSLNNMTINEAQGNKSIYTFVNKKFNSIIPKSNFEL